MRTTFSKSNPSLNISTILSARTPIRFATPIPMPILCQRRNHHVTCTSTATAETHQPPQSHLQLPPKQNTKLLSCLLKPIIMILLTSLFFLFLGFAAIILIHLCLVGGIFHRLRIRGSSTPQLDNSSNGLTPNELKRLQQFRLAKGVDARSETHCVVCLDGFRIDQTCRKLPGCGHVFHRKCIDAWLLKVAACPICRTPVRLNAEKVGFAMAAEQLSRTISGCDNW